MNKTEDLKQLLQTIPGIELAVLVGSRANGSATHQSDWDIAIRWERHINGLDSLQRYEELKQQIAGAIDTHKDQIDLIDIPKARLGSRRFIHPNCQRN
jgi:predicted nucleotidyltransferase